MNRLAAVLRDTILEVRDQKIIYLYLLVAVALILFFGLIPGSLQINGRSLMDSGVINPEMIDSMLGHFFDGFFGFLIFLMVFGSAGLVPSYLRKGRVELNLSKPLSRSLLISLRFVSVYLVMTVILVFVATLIWLTIGIRSGFFMWSYFYGLCLAALQFLIIYAIVFFLGVLTHSAAVAIMGYFMLRIAAGLLAERAVLYPLLGDSIWKTILDGLYHVLPKIGETSANFMSLLGGRGLGDPYPLWSSLLFALALFAFAIWIFRRRDY